VLEETGPPLYPVLSWASEPNSSDFAACVTPELLDFFTEAVSFEVCVPGATDPPLPLVCCDPEDDSTDAGDCTPSLENLKLFLELVSLLTGVPDGLINLAFCSISGEAELFLVCGELGPDSGDFFADGLPDFLEEYIPLV
jgi:hypothetical protein